METKIESLNVLLAETGEALKTHMEQMESLPPGPDAIHAAMDCLAISQLRVHLSERRLSLRFESMCAKRGLAL